MEAGLRAQALVRIVLGGGRTHREVGQRPGGSIDPDSDSDTDPEQRLDGVSPHPSLGAAGLTGGLIEAPPDAWKS